MVDTESTFSEALVRSVDATPYDDKALVQAIVSNRKTLGGTLFFDVLLKDLTGLSSAVYPPRSLDDTLLLLHKVETNAEITSVNKACIILYLFLDYPLELTANESLAVYYADEVGIPVGHRELIQGFWHLDRLDPETALVHLAHPQVLPTYHDKTLAALVRTSAEPARYFHIMAYVTAKCPRLVSPETLDLYVQALSTVSIIKAVRFSRSVSPSSRAQVFKSVIDAVISAKGPAASKNIWRLANLVLTEQETEELNATLLAAIEARHPREGIAKDVVLLRALHTGNLALAKKIAALPNPDSSSARVTWTDLSRGLEAASLN